MCVFGLNMVFLDPKHLPLPNPRAPHGMAQDSMARHRMTWHGMTRHGTAAFLLQLCGPGQLARGSPWSLLATESWHGLGGKGPSKGTQPTPLPWAGTSPAGSGCSEPRPTQPGMFPGMGHQPLLWATWARVSAPSP